MNRKRYVDDTFVVIKTSHEEKFLKHWTVWTAIYSLLQKQQEDGSIPFFDTLVMSQPENSLITTVYRKTKHTDLYLQPDSHHNLAAKFSIINTLTQSQDCLLQPPIA